MRFSLLQEDAKGCSHSFEPVVDNWLDDRVVLDWNDL